MKYLCLILLLIFFVHFVNAITTINFKLSTTTLGYVLPNRGDPNKNITYVLEGSDILIMLAKVPKDYTVCQIIEPDTSTITTLDPGTNDYSARISFWSPNSDSKDCGARIRNVKIEDSGRWKLQALSSNYRIQSFLNLQVKKDIIRESGHFDLKSGSKTEITLTYLANYCEIDNEFISADYNIYDHCSIDLEHVNRMYGGKWNISVGVFGKIDEIKLQPNINVIEEKFDVGFNKTGQKIHMYCNYHNYPTTTKITVCRFLKIDENIGFRLNLGLSNGRYSYYGRGLAAGDCGLTIEKPNPKDFVAWKCTLGLYRDAGEETQTYELKESIITLSDERKGKKRGKRAADDFVGVDSLENDDKEEIVLTSIGSPLIFEIKRNFRMKYCVFVHPNGTLFSINNERLIENSLWESKSRLDVGLCKMKLFVASKNESGIWQYQVSHADSYEKDNVGKLKVRVGDKALVAVDKEIKASIGERITLKCKSVSDPRTLNYCRFVTPTAKNNSFHIDSTITINKAIFNMYYYNSTNDSSLINGDCLVTIKALEAEHFGKWICAGSAVASKQSEDWDEFVLIQINPSLSVASISGIVVGLAAAIIIFGGIIVYYRKRKHATPDMRGRSSYLSSSSHSSGEVTQYQRSVPLVAVEEEIPTREQQVTEQHEEIEIERRSVSSQREHTTPV